MTLSALRSARLTAVPWPRCNATELAALFAPEVVRYLPPGFQGLDDDDVRRSFLNSLADEAEVVALRMQGEGCVGLLILSLPQDGVRHLGYLLARRVWGQGLASEMLAALQDLLGGTGVTLAGGVMDANTASARVLEKAGFVAGSGDGDTVYRWTAP